MTLSNNLNTLMAKTRLTSSELARQTGLPATTIKRIRNNEQTNPTITTLVPIAKYFSISISELIGDELAHSRNNETATTLRQIPLILWHECAEFNFLNYDKYSKKLLTECQVSKKAFALTIEDYDLEFFPNRSNIIVEPECIPESGDYIIVARQGIVSIRKYIVEIDQVYLKPLMTGLIITSLTSEFKILGVILQYKFELKT